MQETVLSKATLGGRFRVTDFVSCLKQRRHLCALGLTQGTEFELRRRECCGACSLIVRGSCLVLDPDSASCIICEPLPVAC